MGEQLAILRLHWDHLRYMARTVRGVTKDRTGKRYWCLIERPSDYFKVSLIGWLGLSYFSQTAGWMSLGGSKDAPTSWFIYDVRVLPRFQQRGVGTALVRAGIALARRNGAQEIRGGIIDSDLNQRPFLPAWYTHLGFTVEPNLSFKMTLTHKA